MTDDLRHYRLRPVLLDAASAHRDGAVVYAPDGTVTLRSAELSRHGKPETAIVPPARQFPIIRATFDDLNKALSRLASSPRLDDGTNLRERYDLELARYDALAAECLDRGGFEPDYGTYVYDHHRGDLYLVAPSYWHRLALVTSNSKLLTDLEGRLSWQDIRVRLEGAVIGVAGLSVGGNVLEGWLREARPRTAKIADPDWVEATNLNRGERMSIRHLVASRGERFDVRNPYEGLRIGKAEYLAYEQHLVDPYLELFVYGDGITRNNIDRFLLGNGAEEPPVDVVAEEMDDLKLKILMRERARDHRVDVLMLSDFGHTAHVVWNLFRDAPDAPLGFGASDAVLHEACARVEHGGRAHLLELIHALCGENVATDQFLAHLLGDGEQPTASMPQSGATAMASGAIGGKEIALRLLGHRTGTTFRFAYDLLRRRVPT